MPLLKDDYTKKAIPALNKQFSYENVHEVPRIEKITVNIGAGTALSNKQLQETMVQTLRRVTGQEPIKRKARKSISNFGIRQGQVIGYKVTLRGARMEAFLEKLIHITLPRVRDFRGLADTAFDGQGNYTFGFKEHNAFPEIKADEVERLHGLQVTITTSAKTDEEGRVLLAALGFPFASSQQ